MSKRAASEQLTSDGRNGDGFGGAQMNGDSTPKRATAAQMAARKIKSAKGRRGPASSSSASINSINLFPPSAHQPPGQTQIGGFGTPGSTLQSLSFPPTNGTPASSSLTPSTSFGGFGTGSASSFTAPSGGFSFSAPSSSGFNFSVPSASVSNPFSSSGQPGPTTTGFTFSAGAQSQQSAPPSQQSQATSFFSSKPEQSSSSLFSAAKPQLQPQPQPQLQPQPQPQSQSQSQSQPKPTFQFSQPSTSNLTPSTTFFSASSGQQASGSNPFSLSKQSSTTQPFAPSFSSFNNQSQSSRISDFAPSGAQTQFFAAKDDQKPSIFSSFNKPQSTQSPATFPEQAPLSRAAAEGVSASGTSSSPSPHIAGATSLSPDKGSLSSDKASLPRAAASSTTAPSAPSPAETPETSDVPDAPDANASFNPFATIGTPSSRLFSTPQPSSRLQSLAKPQFNFTSPAKPTQHSFTPAAPAQTSRAPPPATPFTGSEVSRKNSSIANPAVLSASTAHHKPAENIGESSSSLTMSAPNVPQVTGIKWEPEDLSKDQVDDIVKRFLDESTFSIPDEVAGFDLDDKARFWYWLKVKKLNTHMRDHFARIISENKPDSLMGDYTEMFVKWIHIHETAAVECYQRLGLDPSVYDKKGLLRSSHDPPPGFMQTGPASSTLHEAALTSNGQTPAPAAVSPSPALGASGVSSPKLSSSLNSNTANKLQGFLDTSKGRSERSPLSESATNSATMNFGTAPGSQPAGHLSEKVGENAPAVPKFGSASSSSAAPALGASTLAPGSTSTTATPAFGGFKPAGSVKPTSGGFTLGASTLVPSSTSTTAAPAFGGFKPSVSVKPTPGGFTPSGGFKPSFGAISGSNFAAQFGQQAAKAAEAEKQKRKAAEYDSEEDDEEEWERKYEEDKRAKKAKFSQDTSGKRAMFVPGKGFSFGQSATTQPEPITSTDAEQKQDSDSAAAGNSVLDSHRLAPGNAIRKDNIFGYLSDAGSDTGSSRKGDADDEGEDSSDGPPSPDENRPSAPLQVDTPKKTETPLTAPSTASTTAKGSLFDRITKDNNGNPTRDSPTPADSQPVSGESSANATPKPSNMFGFGATPGDHTWKPASPIKFGASTAGNAASTTPASKPAGLFNFPTSGNTSSGTFAPSTPTVKVSSPAPAFGTSENPKLGVFSGKENTSTRPKFSFFTPSNSTPSGSLFAPASSASNSVLNSGVSSAATSDISTPNVSDVSGAEGATKPSGANASGDEFLPQPQTDLIQLDELQKDHEILFPPARTRAQKLEKKDGAAPEWKVHGVGPIVVLKNRETGVCSILMKAAPGGKVVLNTRLAKGLTYAKNGKRATFGVVSEGKVEQFCVLFKDEETAGAFAAACEGNKG